MQKHILMCCFILGIVLQTYTVLQETPEVLVLSLNKEKWKNAASFCSQGNGTLLTVENKEKLEALISLDKQPVWKNLSLSDVWFGLYGDGKKCPITKYKWHGKEGSLGDWSYWHNEEPNFCNSDKCVRIDVKNFKWRTTHCSQQYRFVCQYKTETCQYDLLPDVRMAAVIVNQTLKDTNLTTCLNRCQIAVQGTLKCWVVEIDKEKPSECTLIFTNDIYLTDKTSNIIRDQSNNLIVRRCTIALPTTGNAETPFLFPDVVAQLQEKKTTCTLPSTESSFYNLLTSDSLNSISMTDHMTQTQHKSGEITDRMTSYHYSLNSVTNLMMSSIAHVESVYFTSALTDLATSSTRADDYTPSVDKFNCRMSNMSSEELRVKIKQMRRELTILKNETSSHRRRLVSVYETRVSAAGMGLVSSVILIVILVAVIVSDFPVFYRQIRHFKIKHRHLRKPT